MTEIRPIEESETETFLDLMCEAFGLDRSRARGIFYSEPMYDLKRKWALFESNEMVSILTTTPLKFGWGNAFGIAGVATRLSRRGEGCASKLLDRVIEASACTGEGAALLFAKDSRVYQRNGFEILDRVVRAPVRLRPEEPLGDRLESEELQGVYASWSEADPHRLRRDSLRWSYWNWHFRVCTPFANGYICFEPGTLRECIFGPPQAALPLPVGTEWLGTTRVASLLQIPLAGPGSVELSLMGRNLPSVPLLFMTDQF